MKRIFKSLRSRILILILLVGMIPILVLHLIVSNTYRASLINQRKTEVLQRVSNMATELGQHETMANALTAENVAVLEWLSDAYNGRVVIVDRSFVILWDTFSADTGKTVISDSIFKAFNGSETAVHNTESGYLEFVLPVFDSGESEKNVMGVLVVSTATDWMEEGLSGVEDAIEILELILIALLIFFSIYLSRVLTNPIKKVAYKMQKMTLGHKDTDLNDLRSYKEVDEILEHADSVIEQYRKMEENQEQFVSNVSHELRTPLTSVKVLTDSMLGQENIPESMYQEFLSDISVEINRESRIIDDLLSMSRYTDTENALNISTVNINDFVLSILKTVKPIAIERGIELIYESFRQVSADIDELKLTQAFTNLIENSVKYNNEGGNVKVSLDADHEYFYLRVQDTGVGIPEDALPHIFERFFRVDKARSRETGGTGLGLSITKQLILLHDGAIKVESKENEGSTFTVRIPLKHIDMGGDNR